MKLRIDFSGSVTFLDPSNVLFEYMGDSPKLISLITGDQYLELSSDEKEEYVLASLSNCIDQGDTELDEITISPIDPTDEGIES